MSNRLARYAVEGSCAKCPSDSVYVTYQSAFNRKAESCWIEAKKRSDDETDRERRAALAKWEADLATWGMLPCREQKRTTRPQRPSRWDFWYPFPRLTHPRLSLDECWDPEHLLCTCAACGFSWRSPPTPHPLVAPGEEP
jgi:hypothetical protein